MLELNSTTFAEAIKSEQPTLVDFWAVWCMPCKIFAPVFEELSDELDGKATFGKINVDDHQDLAVQYGVESIPTVLVFKNGEVVDRLEGVQPKELVVETVNKHL